MIRCVLIDENNVVYELGGITSYNVSRKLNDIGAFRLTLLPSESSRLPEIGDRIEISRVVDSSAYHLGLFIVTTKRRYFQNGLEFYEVSGLCDNVLLKNRVVAYNQGTSQGQKNGYDGQVIIQLVQENLIGVGDSRDISNYGYSLASSGIPQINSISVVAAWRNLYDVVKGIADYSKIYFGFIPFGKRPYGRMFVVRTTFGIYRDIVLPIEVIGNLEIIVEIRDRPNVIYALGAESGSQRTYVTYDKSSTALTRREGTVMATDINGSDQLSIYAEQEYRRNRATEKLTGKFGENAVGIILGRDIGIGDVIGVGYKGKKQVVISAFRVSGDMSNIETEITFDGLSEEEASYYALG